MIDMLNPEQRTASRAICDAATPELWVYENGILLDVSGYHSDELYPLTQENAAFIAHARTALPTALDALEVLEADRDRWRESALNGRTSLMTSDIGLLPISSDGQRRAVDEIVKLRNDRDHWKTRAEALERAMKDTHDCKHCINLELEFNEKPCDGCFDGISFIFDQERFLDS